MSKNALLVVAGCLLTCSLSESMEKQDIQNAETKDKVRHAKKFNTSQNNSDLSIPKEMHFGIDYIGWKCVLKDETSLNEELMLKQKLLESIKNIQLTKQQENIDKNYSQQQSKKSSSSSTNDEKQ